MVTYPKDWEIVDLGDVLEFKNGLNKDKAYFGHGTPIVNYMDVYKKNGLRSNDINGSVSLSRNEIRRFEAKKNDVFFTRTSETPEEVGISAVLLDEIPNCVFSGFVLRGRPKTEGLSPEYCQYCFGAKEFRHEIIKHCTYTTRALTNGKVLSAIKIPLPPLAEQKAIAATLSSFDTHIDNLTALIEKKKAIRDGALSDLMSGRTRLAGFSGEWETKTIGCCVDIYQGGTPSTYRDDYWGGNIVWITPGEITKLKGLYIRDSERKITDRGLENSSAVLLPVGTILLCTRATIGDLAVSSCPITTNQGFKNLICRDDTDNVFFAYLLKKYKDVMIERAKGTTFLELSKTSLSNILVTLPPLAEQKAIADMLTSMDTEIQNLEAERDKMQAIRAGAMDDLLTGRVRLPM